MGSAASQPPGGDEAHYIHQAIPVDCERAEANGHRIDLRILQHAEPPGLFEARPVASSVCAGQRLMPSVTSATRIRGVALSNKTARSAHADGRHHPQFLVLDDVAVE